MSESAIVTTEVALPAPEEGDTSPVEDGDTTVTVVTDSGDDETTPVVVDHEGRLVRIEEQQAQILALLQATSEQVVSAQETADVAVELAVQPEPEPEPEPDTPPAKPHVFHRSWNELLGRS
jgi:hypothetical protein